MKPVGSLRRNLKKAGRVILNPPGLAGFIRGNRRVKDDAPYHRALALVTLGGLLAMFGGGCASVKVQPWERAAFAGYAMRPDRDPLATMAAEHTFFSREAAHGGRGVGGSGCGCN